MPNSGILEQQSSAPASLIEVGKTPPSARLPSVRTLIILIVVVPIAVVSVALISISTLTSRSIAEQLGHEIVDRASERITADVQSYLGNAMRLSDLYVRRIKDNLLPTRGLEAWRQTMFNDLAVNPDVASICFATPQGDCTWLLRAHHRLELGLANGNAENNAIEFSPDESGNIDTSKPIRDLYSYQPRERPWYKAAIESDGPLWTPIYFWFPDQRDISVTGTGYTRAIRDSGGHLIGVLIIDVTLGALSDHLKKMSAAHPGDVFIVDAQGLMVAASQGAVNSPDGKRLTPANSGSPAAKAIADLVSVSAHGIGVAAPEVESSRVFIGDQPALAQISEIKPYPGIHWHIATVLPESSFLSKASTLRQRSILFADIAVLGGLVLGLILSRSLSNPLRRLTAHVARVGAGDFESRLDLGQASELRSVSDEVNKMAAGLKQRMTLEHSLAVATEIQQSLLPSEMPAIPGLEIAACSRYCESTGGDYFDFIHIPTFESHGTLMAVGDVTGHGLGAALLMATARGAVRASCQSAQSLGHILSRSNNVLAGSAHQGMFMTLSLVFVNPETRYIHWASAGHDPVIVYHPDKDSFEELLSGDMPLGIDEDVVYREFSRESAVPGTIVLIGTDGIWEARNQDGQMFGKDRLRELMRDHHDSAAEVSDAIKAAMYNWVGPVPLQDDVTFVVVKIA